MRRTIRWASLIIVFYVKMENRKTGVREITRGSHDIHCMRDMRDALGALGPVDGSNPELNNLTLAITEVERGDIVFLTSDGISDNFDPVVGKFAVLPSHSGVDATKGHDARLKTRRRSTENLRHTESSNMNSNNLPVVEAYQRHELTLLRMEDLLRRGVSGEGPPCNSAKHLCELLLDFAVRRRRNIFRKCLSDLLLIPVSSAGTYNCGEEADPRGHGFVLHAA